MIFRYIFPISFVILILFSGCKDDIPEGQGKASAEKNGESWEAVNFYKYASNSQDTLNIFLIHLTEEGYQRNSLNFYEIPLCLGIEQLYNYNKNDPSVKFKLSYGDGHISGDRYHIIEGHPINHFELTNLNSKTGEINGEFELAMIIDTTLNGEKLDANVPDTVIFRDGEFEINLKGN